MGKGTLRKRFEDKYIPEPNSGCWLWIGSGHSAGYGSIFYNGKSDYAHRVSYILQYGEIPDGLQIDHLCRVRSCVNPDHLEAVTPRVNTKRGNASESLQSHYDLNRLKTHCPHGHEYSEENTLHTACGRRQCKTCNRDRQRRYRRLRGLSLA